MTKDLFHGTSGPSNARVILVGEAWGEEEARQQRPFVGSSGYFLDAMLAEAGLPRSTVLCTNLVPARPEGNDFTRFLVHKDDIKTFAHSTLHGGVRGLGPLVEGLGRLKTLINTVNPALVIAAGNWPLWALSDHTTIKTVRGHKVPSGIALWRGSQSFTRTVDGLRPLLPIYHPAAITREYKLRAITVHDLRTRAARFLNGKTTWHAPPAKIIHRPTLSEALQYLNECLRDGGWLSVDIETYRRKWISCVGFARSKRAAICIPFFSFDGAGRLLSYWSPEQEQEIWALIKLTLESPRTKIIGQNFAYDTQFFKRHYDVDALVSHDTMVAQHLLYPGTSKGLDDLASLYCDHYLFWKKESQDWTESGDTGAEAHWLYNAKDALFTFEIAMAQQTTLASEGMAELYAFQLEQWRLARELTLRGVRWDAEHQRNMRRALASERQRLESWLTAAGPASLADRDTPWFHSALALKDLFYRDLGLPVKEHKKTGAPTFDDSALMAIEETHPWLAPVMQRIRHLRSIRVFTSHFIDAGISPDARIHCQFNITGTETFRWSSSATGFDEGTNLQNVPKPNE